VAYDEAVAQQIRELLAGDTDIEEKKMFGGLAFLVNGNMAVAASGQGGLLVRVDPAEGEKLVASTKATPMEMRGRQMAGWLRVEADDDLPEWVERGRAYACSLPPKS
jgi:TfoX/Sxy family transcriptional regulator of competence genes